MATAGQLQPTWAAQTAGIIESSASIVGTTAYVGSWDGYEYAINTTTGAVLWKTFLGQTTAPICYPWTLGVSSSAAVVNGVVYVGGGNTFYALDPGTGAVLWSVYMADNSQASGHYDWASPLVVNGYAYVGIASICDNPVVQGEMLKIDLTGHDIAATHYFVPNGQLGGGVWTSASYDAASNKIFVTNGNRNAFSQTDTQAVMALDPGTLAVLDSWQIPETQSNGDPDFGTGPILATDAAGDQLVSAVNKNGILYTWNRNNLAAGPVWQHQIAVGGECPECGDGSISTGAYANGVIYWAGGNNNSGSHGTSGSVTAFAAGTGQVLWTRQTDQTIIGAIAVRERHGGRGRGQHLRGVERHHRGPALLLCAPRCGLRARLGGPGAVLRRRHQRQALRLRGRTGPGHAARPTPTARPASPARTSTPGSRQRAVGQRDPGRQGGGQRHQGRRRPVPLRGRAGHRAMPSRAWVWPPKAHRSVSPNRPV